MRKLVADAGLAGRVTLDSAGTGGWHIGELPDPRSRTAAERRGYPLEHRARQFKPGDLESFDLVLAMDLDNLAYLERLARGRLQVPTIRLLRSFEPRAPDEAEVPDPYAGEADGFELVLDICERACRGLLDYVRERV